MKACPGLRSGIDRSGSLSFAIRGIRSPIRPPNRHSGEGRNPEGWGEGIVARGLVPRLVPTTPANPIIPAFAAIQERHGRRNSPGNSNPSQASINSCRIIASSRLCKTNVSAYQHLAGR